MKKINKYCVKIQGDKPVCRYVGNENEFKKEVYKVLLENKDYIVIDDFRFTSLRKNGRDKEIDTPIIFEMKFGTYNDGIHYYYYCYGTRKPESIRKDIEKWIQKKYGYLFDINLNFIK